MMLVNRCYHEFALSWDVGDKSGVKIHYHYRGSWQEEANLLENEIFGCKNEAITATKSVSSNIIDYSRSNAVRLFLIKVCVSSVLSRSNSPSTLVVCDTSIDSDGRGPV